MAEEAVPVVSLLQLDNLFLRHQDLL
jgi:hypothetical protein